MRSCHSKHQISTRCNNLFPVLSCHDLLLLYTRIILTNMCQMQHWSHYPINTPIYTHQATVTLLENMDILIRRTSHENISSVLMPMLFSSLDSSMPQIQNAAFHAISHVIDMLDELSLIHI